MRNEKFEKHKIFSEKEDFHIVTWYLFMYTICRTQNVCMQYILMWKGGS